MDGGPGKTMDNATVQNLIDKLRDLSRQKFADAGRRPAGVRSHRDLEPGQTRRESDISRKQGTNISRNAKSEPSIYELDAQGGGRPAKGRHETLKDRRPPAEEEVEAASWHLTARS